MAWPGGHRVRVIVGAEALNSCLTKSNLGNLGPDLPMSKLNVEKVDCFTVYSSIITYCDSMVPKSWFTWPSKGHKWSALDVLVLKPPLSWRDERSVKSTF